MSTPDSCASLKQVGLGLLAAVAGGEGIIPAACARPLSHHPVTLYVCMCPCRYLLKPSEPCCVSVEYQATSAALQASTQLMLLEVATGRPVQQLQQPSMQLAPSPKGYLLLALCEPLVDVPAGGWSVVLTSDRKLPALAELPCSRQVVFSGVYGPNTKAVIARWVMGGLLHQQVKQAGCSWLTLWLHGAGRSSVAL